VVDAASQRGIVHRDLKPQNLFLAVEPATGDRTWKILDFGASKLGHHSGTLTEGRVVGTPGYLSPEQACGEDVDGAADRYGLAAIAYRCITGRIPFSGKELPGILYKVVHGMPPQPTTQATVPAGVDAVLAVGLAKRAQDRFESAAEFVDALESALAGHHDDWLQRRADALLADFPWGISPKR
jgi:serine/threonine-protein kinase